MLSPAPVGRVRLSHTRVFAVIPGKCLKSETAGRSEMDSNHGATSAREGQIQPEIGGYFGGFIPCVNYGEHIRL
jgi:hypothetical protein